MLVTVMFTLGTTDPEGSVTVPTMVASWPNAASEKPKSRVEKIAKRRRLRPLQACKRSPAHMDIDFISSLRNVFSTVFFPTDESFSHLEKRFCRDSRSRLYPHSMMTVKQKKEL